MKSRGFWEMLVEQSQESLGQISFHVFTVGGLKQMCAMTQVTFVVLIRIGKFSVV